MRKTNLQAGWLNKRLSDAIAVLRTAPQPHPLATVTHVQGGPSYQASIRAILTIMKMKKTRLKPVTKFDKTSILLLSEVSWVKMVGVPGWNEARLQTTLPMMNKTFYRSDGHVICFMPSYCAAATSTQTPIPMTPCSKLLEILTIEALIDTRRTR